MARSYTFIGDAEKKLIVKVALNCVEIVSSDCVVLERIFLFELEDIKQLQAFDFDSSYEQVLKFLDSLRRKEKIYREVLDPDSVFLNEKTIRG